MKEKLDITVSIVLYNENLEELTETINCFLSIPLKKKLYLIDNTPEKMFNNLFLQNEIEYIAIGHNIGFGSGHNIVLDKIDKSSRFHLVLNPDVFFKPTVILNLIKELANNKEVAMIAPKVLFPDGRHQYSCRRYPSVSELIARRFSLLKPFFTAVILKGEYRERDLKVPFFAEYITGCFQLYRTEDFIALKGFDKRYFLYMEDVDICKKIDVLQKKKIYFPQEEIIHVLKQGSSKSKKLFLRHTLSVVKYFFKWGF